MNKTVYKLCLGMIFSLSIPSLFAEEVVVSKVSVPALSAIKKSTLFKLEKNETIDNKKALGWKINAIQYYFLPVAYKVNQGCRFVFIDDTNKKTLSDGGFSFEKCTFIKAPELLDINKDGQLDFRVLLRLPHVVGSKAFVNHHFDFIFDTTKNMFCEQESGIPCN